MKKNTFLRVICPRCKMQRIVFSKSSLKIKCNKCNYLILKTRGGKAKLRSQVLEVLQ